MKNPQALSNLNETWSKYLPDEVIKLTKFHEDRTKIVHFFFWRKLSPVYAMKRATFKLIRVQPCLWEVGMAYKNIYRVFTCIDYFIAIGYKA